MLSNIKKFLIVAPSWVGDLVMAQSLLRLLKEKFPDCSIDVFASEYLHPLLKRMPEVNKSLVSPFHHGELKLFERFKVAKTLQKEAYDQVYVLPNSIKSALIPFFSKIPIRTGWRGEQRYFLLNDIRVLQKEKLPLMVERFVSLGYEKDEEMQKPLLLPKLQPQKEKLEQSLERLKLTLPEKPILAICPGAEYGPAKRWPTSYFAQIAKTKKNEGWEIWIFGGAKEKELSEEIQEKSGNVCVDLTGKTDLGEVVDLMSLATVVIANDTGLMHIAAALERPLVAIYGSSTASYTPPLLNNNCKVLSLNLSCSPCFKRECPLGHTKCLNDLKPELVSSAIKEVVPNVGGCL